MLNTKTLESLVEQLSAGIPDDVKAVKQDLERNFRSVLQSGFSKLDLVSREEFDVQAGVLERTREKLNHLEEQIAALEKKLKAHK